MHTRHSCRFDYSLPDTMLVVVQQPAQGRDARHGTARTNHDTHCALSQPLGCVQSLQGQLQTPARHSGHDSDDSPAGFSPCTPDGYVGSTGGLHLLEAPASVISEVNPCACLLL
jgi:hypothetical protein